MSSVSKRQRLLITIYCIAVGLSCALSIAALALRYPALGDRVPLHLLPWGGVLKDVERNVFYVLRLPVMGLCLQLLLLGLYPDRMEDWPDDAYRHMRSLLMGLSLVTLSQLTLNPQLTMGDGNAVLRGVTLCALLVVGLVITVLGLVGLHRLLKPRCKAQQTPYTLLLDFVFSGCKRRRALVIASVAAFMVLLVLPSLRY